VNWHEFAISIPEMPSDEVEAKRAYVDLLDKIASEVDAEDRELALSALGDTWGETARFRGWSLEPKEDT
jgi:hypothetical protein